MIEIGLNLSVVLLTITVCVMVGFCIWVANKEIK